MSEVTVYWSDEKSGESGSFTTHPDANVRETLREHGISEDAKLRVESPEDQQSK